jgi:hypothetical protein
VAPIFGSFTRGPFRRRFEERRAVARRCEDGDGDAGGAVDDMEDSAAKAYAAHPDRRFIVGPDGRVAYREAGDRAASTWRR